MTTITTITENYNNIHAGIVELLEKTPAPLLPGMSTRL
jgi:hypothetical protein